MYATQESLSHEMKCAALALLAAPALANPTVTSLRSRSRALKEELTSRVQRYNEHATSSNAAFDMSRKMTAVNKKICVLG